jgi:SAM-dependent methyltransferase
MNEHEAVITTRRAYEADAVAWASRRLDRADVSPRIVAFSTLVQAFRPDGRVLDLGCGPGFDSVDLSKQGLAVVGVDVTRAMLAASRERPECRQGLVQGDSRSLPFRNAAFAGVWASASLLHLPKSQVGAALAEVARVMANGGVFYSAMKEGTQDGFDEPAPGAAISSSRYFAHYRVAEWTALLEGGGFRVREQDIDPDHRAGFPDWIVTTAVRA